MVHSSAQLCGRTVRSAVEAIGMGGEIRFLRKLARIFRKIGIDGSASLFGYSGGECRKPRIAAAPPLGITTRWRASDIAPQRCAERIDF